MQVAGSPSQELTVTSLDTPSPPVSGPAASPHQLPVASTTELVLSFKTPYCSFSRKLLSFKLASASLVARKPTSLPRKFEQYARKPSELFPETSNPVAAEYCIVLC